LQEPTATSILNVLPAVVTGLIEDQAGQCVVRLRVGEQPLLAHVTSKSAALLKLQANMPVFVQIKGTSLLG